MTTYSSSWKSAQPKSALLSMTGEQLKGIARRTLRRLGLEVQRTVSVERNRRAERDRSRRQKWQIVQMYSPNTVLDVGANIGQFARVVRELLPQVRIISFEPLQCCRDELERQKAFLAPFELVPSALGAEAAIVSMNRNAFSPSSSILDMETLHVEEIPKSSEVTPEEVRVQRLDDLSPELRLEAPLFVKIDVQGFEEQVLLGGEETVKSAAAVVAEISSYPLYRGEASFDRIYELMRSWDFAYRGNVDQWVSQRDGRILQFDALFENERLVNESADQELNGK